VKVLQLSTHSTLVPRHGGQLRSHHIGRYLEQAGFEVARLSMCWRQEHDLQDVREPIVDVSLSPFWSSPAYRAAASWIYNLGDYYSMLAVREAPRLRDELLGHISAAAPDVIFIEHPWTWPLIKDLPAVHSGAIRIVYSSHNVETVLKRKMVEDAGIYVPAEVLECIDELERDLVDASWGIITCTQADANVYREWGATNIVVANNGAVAKNRDHLRGVLPPPLQVQHRFALFIGSKYLPNVSGFFKFLAPALPRLRPNTRVVVVGTVCEHINTQINDLPLRDYMDRRLVSLGFVDDLTLDALIGNASALLLPIEYGGGSHLKTAEALASGRPIIGTTASFRGFSEYESLDRVTIVDTPEAFEFELHRSMTDGADDYTVSSPHEVLWDATLAPILQLMRS